jgi:hypothetical protein
LPLAADLIAGDDHPGSIDDAIFQKQKMGVGVISPALQTGPKAPRLLLGG